MLYPLSYEGGGCAMTCAKTDPKAPLWSTDPSRRADGPPAASRSAPPQPSARA